MSDQKITGETSDGFHTFNELYDHRMLLTAALVNHWAVHDPHGPDHHDVHKSWLHHDGTMFGGMFKVVAQLPTGQISYHFDAEHWDLFTIPERERAVEWDGHTAADVAERLRAFLVGGAV